MDDTCFQDSALKRYNQDFFSSDAESFNIYSRSTQMKSEDMMNIKVIRNIKEVRNISKEMISVTTPHYKVMNSEGRGNRGDDLEQGVFKTSSPLMNMRRQFKAGRLKRLIESKDEQFSPVKQRNRNRQQVLPINITRLKPPFLIELLNKGLISELKGESTKRKRVSDHGTKAFQESHHRRKVEKCLKEIYEKQFHRNRMFYDIPLSQAVLEQTNFLNIQSIKPANPQESLRRKSVMSLMRKRYEHEKDLKSGMLRRKSLDATVMKDRNSLKTANSQILQSKNNSPGPLLTRNSSHKKPFKPPFQKYYYRDFIWKIAYSHSFVVEIPLEQTKPFRAYIGNGNNKLLIKSLLKQRSWWLIVEKYDESCNFVWTQIKIPEIFKGQRKNTIEVSGEIRSEEESLSNDCNILTSKLQSKWNSYFHNRRGAEQKIGQQMISRNKYFHFLRRLTSAGIRTHNHLQNNYIIGNKKALFQTMSIYYKLIGKDVFQYLPTTFHISSGIEDPEYSKFLNLFYEKAKVIKRMKSEESSGSPSNTKPPTNAWIVKPGQFTNRGNGIHVCLTLEEIKALIKTKQKHPNGNPKTYIVQTYLDRPLLYNRRKFDIRHYIMISSLNGVIRGYWYEEGYLRTTSFEYNLGSCSSGIHLTNDAIQKHLPEYGRYQKGNKLSYSDFEVYLQKHYGDRHSFYRDVYPRMKEIATDAIRASYLYIDRERREHNFEIFGMDFMIDDNFQPWCIEINTNPCLELSCPLLARLIPQMVQNSLLVGLDPLFPPPSVTINKGKPFKENFNEMNRFQLVFDSAVEGASIEKLYSGVEIQETMEISEDDEVYEDEGREIEEE